MCAVASLENEAGQVRVSREVTFHQGHEAMDRDYGWGFRWTTARK
jgi:tellurite resistance protein TerA